MKRKISFFFLLISSIIGRFFVQRWIFADLPEVTYDQLQESAIGSTITDRNGVVLYQFFLEDREYVKFEDIPPQVVDALVSVEDHRYREHTGIDRQGISRAIVHNIKILTGEGGSLQGGSSISQQLIKNMYLTPERSIKRKLQEMILTMKMTSITRRGIQEERINDSLQILTEEELDIQSKKLILERYINYVFFGNNSYGIKVAAKNYFGLELEELNTNQIAILAGIVKAPTTYNPLTNPKSMLGYRSINDGETTYILGKGHELSKTFLGQISKEVNKKHENIVSLYSGNTLDIEKATNRYLEYTGSGYDNSSIISGSYLSGSNISDNIQQIGSGINNFIETQEGIITTKEEAIEIDKNDIVLSFLEYLGEGVFINNETSYDYQYHPGRKDVVLRNRLTFGNLSIDNLMQSFLGEQPTSVESSRPIYSIKAPHFVFWIRNLLLHDERLSYLGVNSHELLTKGYTIQTTLDTNLQDEAESASHQTYRNLLNYEGTNRSMLHIDSSNGEVLSYLGSHNYFDGGIDGAVDMIQANRQQGSVLKPFIYAKLLETYGFATDGRIADKKLTGWSGQQPQNADGIYEGSMSITKALTNSKNLPAIRAFIALGGERIIKPYFQELGLTSILTDVIYGWSVALGAAEENILNLASAYLQLSHTGEETPTIFPIQKILDPEGNIIADYSKCHNTEASFQDENLEKVCDSLSTKSIIPKGVRYLVREMLTDRSQLYSFWKPLLEIGIPGKFAIKTGTSDVKKEGVIYPRDAYTALYSPDEIIIMWSGNNSGKPLKYNSFSAQINQQYLSKYINNSKNQYDRSNGGYIKPEEEINESAYANPLKENLDRYAEKYLWGKEK